MFLIVGLGNPGPEYADSRHNLGFKVIDELAKRLGITNFKNKCSALVAEGRLADHKVFLAAPQTFMNNSGLSVRELAGWYKIEPEKIIVIYDDLDLELGQLRIREKGNAGGHHGVESLIEHLATTNFPRVRIGLGRQNLVGDAADYVLQKIPPGERDRLEAAVGLAAEAVEMIVTSNLAAAMNKFND